MRFQQRRFLTKLTVRIHTTFKITIFYITNYYEKKKLLQHTLEKLTNVF